MRVKELSKLTDEEFWEFYEKSIERETKLREEALALKCHPSEIDQRIAQLHAKKESLEKAIEYWKVKYREKFGDVAFERLEKEVTEWKSQRESLQKSN